MKPAQLFISTLVLMFLSTSCEKIGEGKIKTTTVTGQVRTYGTEDPAKGAPVGVMLWHRKDRINDGFVMIDSVETDENGWYTITHDLDENEEYFLSAEGYPYKLYVEMRWLSRSFTRRAQVPVGGSHTIHLEPVAYGYVRFHFKSLNSKNGAEYTYNLGAGAFETFYNSVDTYRLWDFGGNLHHRIYLNYYDGTLDSNWKQEFFPISFDTIPILVEF